MIRLRNPLYNPYVRIYVSIRSVPHTLGHLVGPAGMLVRNSYLLPLIRHFKDCLNKVEPDFLKYF